MLELKIKARFDDEKCRQYLNDELSVFHCHHYSTLFSQLADDAKLLSGTEHMKSAAAESMLTPIKKFCLDNNISSPEDRISIAEQYYSYVGLGKLKINLSTNSAEMVNSHVDEGWIKKWGTREQPVNYIGQGFIAAAFALAYDDDPVSYSVEETQSIVSGAKASQFNIKKN